MQTGNLQLLEYGCVSMVPQKMSSALWTPGEFDSATGLERLLDVLRQSPLQKLPVPDSFSRLERWTGLRGSGGEEISSLLVREEELFVELKQALQRARVERAKAEKTSTGVGARERDPSESPSRSPQGAGFGGV